MMYRTYMYDVHLFVGETMSMLDGVSAPPSSHLPLLLLLGLNLALSVLKNQKQFEKITVSVCVFFFTLIFFY